MEFKELLEVAQFLNKKEEIIKIDKLIELEKNRSFYLTFWGHYSAGKSKLINRIIERDLLPVQTRETTAILTYIQYGEEERCLFYYEDGSIKTYEINVLKDVFQNTTSFEDIDKIDHIEVCINNNLLKNGLILVDTPGINTIIQKHQNLAIDSIEQSGRIIYVLGNAPTNVDKEFIKQIINYGIKISFIRTKCDRFIEEEENIYLALEKEKEELAAIIEGEYEYIPVSNEKDSKWFKNIDKIKDLLLKISNDISKEMDTLIKEKKERVIKKYIEELKENKKYLDNILENKLENINSEINNCEEEIDFLSEILDDLENKMDKRSRELKKEIEKAIDNLITKRAENFSKDLSKIENSKEIEELYLKHLLETIEKVQNIINLNLNKTIEEETKKLSDYLIEDEKLPVLTYSEVQQENTRVLEMYRSKLKEAKEKLEEIFQNKNKNRELLEKWEENFNEESYNEALSLLDEELSKIPSGIAYKLSEEQDIQPSSIFKKIGTVADLALLLLPGKVIFSGVKAAANTTKIAQGVHKLGKAGEVIAKAGTIIGKNANKIDGVRDVVYTLNTVLKRRNYSTKSEKEIVEKVVNKAAGIAEQTFTSYTENKKVGNVLDALSIAYWAEKFGKNFDSAPKMEIDIEEQQNRIKLKDKITAEQQKIILEKISRKKELGLLKSKDDEFNLLEQEQVKIKALLEKEIKRHEDLIKKESEISALKKYKKDYEIYYQEKITKIANEIFTKYFKTVNQNLTMHLASQSKEVLSKIERKKEYLNNLLILKNDNGDKEIKKNISICDDLLKKLEINI